MRAATWMAKDNPSGPYLLHYLDCSTELHSVSHYTIQDGLSVELSVTPLAWREGFHSIKVHLSSAIDQAPALRKRQSVGTTTSVSAVSTTVAFPSAPTASPTASKVSDYRLNMAFNNTQILPPNFPGVDGASLHGPFIPHGFTVGCKSCTLGGTVDITNGMFSLSSSNTTEGLLDFYDDGFIEVTLNAFAAHIELQSTVAVTQNLVTFQAPFPDITIPGFSIAGIAEVGPVLRPSVVFGINIASALDFTYGLQVTVPNNATIRLNLTDPASSTMTGFQNATVKPLPFTAALSSINLTASISFSPQLLLTVSAFDSAAALSVGAFLDIPRVSATVAEVRHINELCAPTSNITNSSGLNPEGHFYFDNLTNIIPKVDIDLGVLAVAKLHAGQFTAEEDKVYTAFATSTPLPTACLIFDQKAKTFGDPKATASAIFAKLQGNHDGKQGKSAANRAVGLGFWVGMMLAGFVAALMGAL